MVSGAPMQDQYVSINRHYGEPDIVQRILDTLRDEGKDLEAISQDDLSPLDQYHSRALEATLELAELAGVSPGIAVLDAGCGIGGPSRVLASRFGCRVTGVDITKEFCDAARELTRLVGLQHLVAIHEGSALETPFADGAFDLVWTQHASMNIEDKPRLYREFRRVLKPGARLAIHDICAGASGPPSYPLPWAEEPSISFLVSMGEIRRHLESLGFRALVWTDRTAVTAAWLEERQSRGAGAARAVPDEKLRHRGENLLAGFRTGSLAVFQAVLEAPN